LAKLPVHEKAVPAMIEVIQQKPDHGGTADEPGKEAASFATAGQVVIGFGA
jgi:hypothetical protein